VKYLFLILGGIIAWSSMKAYRELGTSLFGGMGGIGAIAVFALVQMFELKPILMTNGQTDIFGGLAKIAAGKTANLPECDVEELLDAVGWATLGYTIDFVAGLFVWPIVPSWDLLRMGGVTAADVAAGLPNLFQIIACVFLLQICIQQFLKRGGKLPFGGARRA
jgi:hypothetical protein